jgi:elongation factor Ts
MSKEVTIDSIKELRRITQATIADCREALRDSGGDLGKAVENLRKKGLEIAAKKAGRQASEGRIESYIHFGSKIGVLIEVGCETDFVARNEEFAQFTRNLAMQIAAARPLFIKKEDVPPDILAPMDEESRIAYIKQHCLLEQLFIKDQSLTIKDCLAELIAKIGENIVVRRFVRFALKEEPAAAGI